jgi:hypothetical protein
VEKGFVGSTAARLPERIVSDRHDCIDERVTVNRAVECVRNLVNVQCGEMLPLREQFRARPGMTP